MKQKYDELAFQIAKETTKKYSTSFSFGIKMLDHEIRDSIYGIYGFVRLADEIVDSFHGFKQVEMLENLKEETFNSINNQISTNPIMHAFQATVNKYDIPRELIEQFLYSMEMDLTPQEYSKEKYEEYILGSAEVVGLMCLLIFLKGDKEKYNELKPFAMKLGSAFQKINFLRDLKDDYSTLGRTYFPNIDLVKFDNKAKAEIEKDIEIDFMIGYEGIKRLPVQSRLGVYIAYVFYKALFNKIKKNDADVILKNRVRIPNGMKASMAFKGYLKHSFNLL
jgi:phytoene/squalene synthetase